MIQIILRKFNIFDIVNNIETGAFVNKEQLCASIDSPNKEHMNRYEPADVKQLKKMFEKLISIDSTVLDNGFIDYGCGKGRVLIMAERMRFRSVIGVEFSKHLCTICEDNLRKAKTSMVKVFCKDAVNYELTGDIKTFYFFNPFNSYVLDKVLAKIKLFIKTKSYDGYIVYVYPNKFGRLNPSEYELLFLDDGPINPFHIYKVKA